MALSVPASRAISRTHSSSSFVFDIPTDRTLELAQSPHYRTRTPAFQLPAQYPQSPSYLVISGGTGCNAICSAFGEDVCYVLPVSDNGGSSSEIIRVLGKSSRGSSSVMRSLDRHGYSPSGWFGWTNIEVSSSTLQQLLGDIRSRLIRLIPAAPPSSPTERIRKLLSHRLPGNTTEQVAREMWHDIVEGRSELWHGIPADRKETIRGFLVYFDGQVLKRANKRFSFKNASIGNFLLTAAHLFFRSVPSAIFLFSSITGSKADILPVLVTNHTVTIAAELANGQTLVGQCEISHPSPSSVPSPAIKPTNTFHIGGPSHGKGGGGNSDDDEEEESSFEDDWAEDAMGVDAGSSVQNVNYTKEDETHQSLEAPIRRLFYINQYGQEIHPLPNPAFLRNLNTKSILVYSCGSLYTSIVPCLALRNVAAAIGASRTLRAKVLLLNAKNDRETENFTALDYLTTITNVLNRHDSLSNPNTSNPNPSSVAPSSSTEQHWPISAFITHVVYLSHTEVSVNESAIAALGIQCIEVESESKEFFDADAVERAMDAVMATIRFRDEGHGGRETPSPHH